jgi:hypothetical protein
LARRGDPDALKLLRAPVFPSRLSYLFELYAEFMLWHDRARVPEWVDFQAWASLMRHRVTPFDMRGLRQIHDAYGVTLGKA